MIVCPDGKPIYPEYLSQLLAKMQKKAGFSKCRSHDLRYMCASIMLMQDVKIKVVQQHLGNKDLATTYGIYSHGSQRGSTEDRDLGLRGRISNGSSKG